jgi:hypothetical protein
MRRILVLVASAGVVLVGCLVGGTSGGSSRSLANRPAVSVRAAVAGSEIAGPATTGVASPPIDPISPPLVPAPTPQPSGPPPTPLPVSASQSLSSPGQIASILQPTSCTATGDSITARGSLAHGTVPKTGLAWGDVVELYVYSSSTPTTSVQLATLSTETTGTLSPTWTASATVTGTFASQLGASATCVVALQSTHALMAPGNAGATSQSPAPPPVPTPVPETPPTTSPILITGAKTLMPLESGSLPPSPPSTVVAPTGSRA